MATLPVIVGPRERPTGARAASHADERPAHTAPLLVGRAIWLALAMAVLDGSIANVALPTIAQDLGASAATSVWIVNAYQLTITILLLPLGGARRPVRIPPHLHPRPGAVHSGSVGCALAHSLTALIAARVFQGTAPPAS